MARLHLKNVNKRWGSYVAVKDFDLDIADQEFLVLLGPSGCGKSTTMRMIAGLEDVTEGEIWLGERMVNDLEPKDRDISMVFQSYGLYPNLTVYENIRFPLRVRKVPKDRHEEMVMNAIRMVELEPFMHRRPAELSGGQRQRVALGRAIVRKPTVFLMDEPLSNLDAKLRVSTRAQIKNLQSKLKTTTVYVTHDQIEAMTLADRIVIMNHGEIQQIGTPDEIYANPGNTFVAGFIGSPPMNLVAGEIENGAFVADGIRIEGAVAHLGASSDQHRITLGIRPEDCRVGTGPEHLKGTVYGIEPTGDQTFLTARVGEGLFEIKADRDYRAPLDAPFTKERSTLMLEKRTSRR